MKRRNCIDCGRKIPEKRLAALPNARRCVRCIEADGDVDRHHDAAYIPAYKAGSRMKTTKEWK